jgi:hypothetical protein
VIVAKNKDTGAADLLPKTTPQQLATRETLGNRSRPKSAVSQWVFRTKGENI